MQIDTSSQRKRIVAVLGPTNTGKTHLALDRMLAHSSGMIGFPLRLLARENYDRVVAAKGVSQVALMTGEEKIVPPHARYFMCTVESMPVRRKVAFLAVDEIQLAADRDRGHVFTERLLSARGEEETMFMGSDTVSGLIRTLVPEAEIQTRPRFSTLTHTGSKKVTRLPGRSAIVAFSSSDVYALAELMRRQKGGAAVVLGALSPRTRNAQVAMYQAGEVDYLVATDAIGMGLNMDVNHVAFAGTCKFDGRGSRELSAAELAQIAGRAGRHMNNGTFGTTADAPPFENDIVERLESHEFEPVKSFFWRNTDLEFASLDALRASLTINPQRPGLVRSPEADDQRILARLTRDQDILDFATTPDGIGKLWEVCRIPDFRKGIDDTHLGLMDKAYQFLMTGDGKLPRDWVSGQISQIDRTEGDIDALVQRIAHIRTWTYISHHGQWLHDPEQWQEQTRAIEDRLSDALHQALTQRFVDQRTSVLLQRLKDRDTMTAELGDHGEVEVEGHHVGHLSGFLFIADDTDTLHAGKAVTNAALKALRGNMAERIASFMDEENTAFSVNEQGQILWGDAEVARLVKGKDILSPRIEVNDSDLLSPPAKVAIAEKLTPWLTNYQNDRLGPLSRALERELSGTARGLVFQLSEGLGSLRREQCKDQVDALDQPDRRTLRKLGITIGRESLFFAALLKPAATAWRTLLWGIWNDISPIPSPPPAGRVSFDADDALPDGFFQATGFRKAGKLALRIDMIERLAELAWESSKKGIFTPSADFLSLAGCTHQQIVDILLLLGYRRGEQEGTFKRNIRRISKKPIKQATEADPKARPKKKPTPRPQPRPEPRKVDPNHPFAALQQLLVDAPKNKRRHRKKSNKPS